MKKYLALLVAGILCACCLGLVACGGSSSSSAASSGSTSAASSAASESAASSAASESASASAASASASASASSAATANASSAASDEVSPELKEAAEKLVALTDETVALVEKGKAEGYDAIKAEWDELSDQIDEATKALKPWAQKIADGTISDADKAYYNRVVLPAASKSASASLDILDLIEF